ncbi:MAG: FtsW/RodA/SpoVE family cell cycle protein [Salinimicrobium sediminis]|uniref:Probable peptidoglycan glycosyltransferase FtsW n=2 Tax=Salinimicrobium TaxID=561367 RepID=A0A285X1Y9_9FLAO|nr:FtsW/RodA/SpoVE family cell cycle protein [Salinimicrobium sediminis]MDX1603819.1 FtsW/RodA/SpoVE family cell cycle protein [Salinimicrobium sediminis]SOC78744.1 cell division protein FtsW [Salinimicrobium sediminis]
MTEFFSRIKGDKTIWAAAGLLAIFSFLPVYSASSNLAYLYGDGSTFPYLVNHFIYLFLGFVIMFFVHKVPYHYFVGLSILVLPILVLLLAFTVSQGMVIDGANASRWVTIPFLNKTFQTSTLASVVLLTYVARYMAKMKDKPFTFKQSIIPLWLPVALVLGLILPANFSTTAILFAMVLLVVFIGGYPLKYLAAILGAGIIFLSIFMLTAKAFPGLFPNRVDTWISRVENFSNDEVTEADYQIEKAKIAIASGGVTGQGIGKSVQRNFLPQSSSDFIYAIIIEEMGLIGGLGVMSVYLLLFFRIIIVATKANSIFGKLLVIGVGLPIVFQALVNMAVAVELFPVTGQNLPLISSGGSSIWMTCLALGMVLSVSAKREEELQQQREERLGDADNPLEILSEAI